jgi:uncharacterized protein YwgA
MEDKRALGIYMVMNELGGFKIDDIEDRVYLQKAIYLLQLLGVDLRFRFRWYLRGPYSRELALYSFDIRERIDEFKELADSAQIRKVVAEKVSLLKNIVQKQPADIGRSKWLELISSVHYVKHISSANPESITRAEIQEALEEAGKREFKKEQIEEAWQELEALDLIKNKSHGRLS